MYEYQALRRGGKEKVPFGKKIEAKEKIILHCLFIITFIKLTIVILLF
jgi:hypothetical protein